MMGLLSSVAFTACTDNDDNSVWEDTGNVVFTSQIQGVQAARVSNQAWDNGDEIGIFMQSGNTEVANQKYTASTSGKLTAAAGSELKYPAEGTSSFIAYYPFTSSLNGKSVTFSVADQSNPSKIDFLYSYNATNVKNGEVVNLAFSHQLSNIVVNIQHDETITTTKGIGLSLTGMNTSATFNLADGSMTADSQATINMLVNAEGTQAQAIVLPAAAEGINMTFTLNEMNFNHELKAPENKFMAGCKYTYDATLSIFNGQPVIKLGDATITEWVDKAGGNIDVDFEGGEAKPDKPTEDGVLLNENFDASQGAFTMENILLPEGSTYVWKHAQFDNDGKIVPPLTFMKASAYVGKKCASEAWLVSPALQLPADKAAKLQFHHCHKFSTDKAKELTLLVAEAGTAVAAGAAGWTEVTIPTYGTGNDYNYVLATVDLSAYKGKNIQFAYRYISTTESASTWQISDVKVYTGEGSVEPDPEPEPEPTPGEAGVLCDESFGTPEKVGKYWPNVDKYTGWSDSHGLTYSDPVMTGSYSNASVRATSTMDGHIWLPAEKESALRIDGFKTAGLTSVTMTYDITANAAGEQSVIKVSTDKGAVTVPAAAIPTQNKYQTVTVTLPAGFTWVQFTSEAATNTVGYRIDNVKVVGK